MAKMSAAQRRLSDDDHDGTFVDDMAMDELDSDGDVADPMSDVDRHTVSPRKKQRSGVTKQTKSTSSKSRSVVEAERAPRNRIRKFYRSEKKPPHNYFTAAW
jgi:hypothetical protein